MIKKKLIINYHNFLPQKMTPEKWGGVRPSKIQLTMVFRSTIKKIFMNKDTSYQGFANFKKQDAS